MQNLTTAGVTDQDFGYTADGWKAGKGMIGDTYGWTSMEVVQGAGEPGIEGVVVKLYARPA